MRRSVLLVVLLVLTSMFLQPPDAFSQNELPVFLKNPCLSPDGTQVAFDYDGDIWIAPTQGGEAKRLTLHLAFERRPYFSPDGKWLVYSAAYYGNYDLFVIPVTGGAPRRLTFAPSSEIPSGFSPDGKMVYFYSFRDNVYDIFRIPFEGGTSTRIVASTRDYLMGASVSPDGSKIAFNYRSSYSEWNRRKFVSPNTSDIYLGDNTCPSGNYVQLTKNWNQDFLPLWSPDGEFIYFVSDRDGSYNLYKMTTEGDKSSSQITKFTDNGIRWYTVASKTGDIVAEREHRLYRIDPSTGESKLIEITFYNPPKVTEPEIEKQPVTITDFSVSPDGKKIAFISGHNIYVMASSGGYAKALTATPERELHLEWAPDSNFVIFNRIIEGVMQIVKIDIRDGSESILTTTAGNKYTPSFMPDGKTVVYQYEYEEFRSFDISDPNAEHKTDAKGVFARRLLTDGRWFDITKDGKWLMYNENNSIMGMDCIVKKLGDDTEPVNMSVLGANCYPAGFTPDYKHFLMSNYISGSQVVYVFDFVKEIKPRESPVQKLEDLLAPPEKPAEKEGSEAKAKTEEKPADKPNEPSVVPGDSVDFSNLEDKVRPLAPSLRMSHYVAHIMNNGKAAIVVGYTGNTHNFYVVPIDGGSPQQLTNTPESKTGVEVDAQERNIYYISGGALYALPLSTRTPRKLTPATLNVPRNEKAIRRAVFNEILWLLDTGFYDPAHHGNDISYLRAVYTPLVEACTNEAQFRSLMDELVSEFNASHMGVEGRPNEPTLGIAQDMTPHIGFWFDDALMEKGTLRITRLLDGTPAGAENSGLKVGDYILSINGVKIAQGINIYELVRNKLGEEIKLQVADAPDGEPRTVFLPTIDLNGFYQANLADWEESCRRYVKAKSNGRFAYIHLRSMMDGDFVKFQTLMTRYLASHDGFVLDFRYNSGGRISHQITEYLDDKPWLFSKMRGGRLVPEDVHRDFSVQKAVVGLFNFSSFSNAEMMCAGFRLKGLGPTVGMPTSGGVIGTWPKTLLDGSSMRLPRFMVIDYKGRNLELNPTEPDFIVDETFIDEANGKHPQLDKALEELAKEAEKNSIRLNPQSAEKK
ncbi:MAG: S41 family peptidase [Planctomycetota bacterium]